MENKFIISVKKTVVKKAASDAKSKGQSLSELVEGYLENLTKDNYTGKVSPRLQGMIGSVKLPSNFNPKKNLRLYYKKAFVNF